MSGLSLYLFLQMLFKILPFAFTNRPFDYIESLMVLAWDKHETSFGRRHQGLDRLSYFYITACYELANHLIILDLLCEGICKVLTDKQKVALHLFQLKLARNKLSLEFLSDRAVFDSCHAVIDLHAVAQFIEVFAEFLGLQRAFLSLLALK